MKKVFNRIKVLWRKKMFRRKTRIYAMDENLLVAAQMFPGDHKYTLCAVTDKNKSTKFVVWVGRSYHRELGRFVAEWYGYEYLYSTQNRPIYNSVDDLPPESVYPIGGGFVMSPKTYEWIWIKGESEEFGTELGKPLLKGEDVVSGIFKRKFEEVVKEVERLQN